MAEPQAVGEITATELNGFLEGDIELDGMSACFETILEWFKKTGNSEATIVITVKNDLDATTKEDEE